MEDVMNQTRIEGGIHAVLGTMADKNLTIAESIQVIRSVDYSLKSMYPQAYSIVAEKPFEKE